MTSEPLFSDEQVKADGRTRVTNTGGQNGLAAAVMLIVVGALHGLGLLHGDLSNELFAAWVLVLTVGFAALTNLSKLRGKQ